MILYNSENSIRDIRSLGRPLLWSLLHLSYSGEPVMRLDYQILLKSLPPTLLPESAPGPNKQNKVTIIKFVISRQDRYKQYCFNSTYLGI